MALGAQRQEEKVGQWAGGGEGRREQGDRAVHTGAGKCERWREEARQGPGSRHDREGSARRISDVKSSSLLNKYPRAFQRGPVLQWLVPLQLPLFL